MRQTKRVDWILSNSGCGSRKQIKALIKEGAVKADGKTVTDGGQHVDPDACLLTVHEAPLLFQRYKYVMMNKPVDVISATTDNKHKTVADLLPEPLRSFELFPAGRLDIDTEGFVLMTNDGQLAHELLSPKKHVGKRYYALIEGCVSEVDITRFKEGVTLEDGYRTLPAELEVLRAGEISEIELVIYEGKFHQVKRMFEAVGKRVRFLKRLSIGSICLDEGLAPGECRELTAQEVEMLKREVALLSSLEGSE